MKIASIIILFASTIAASAQQTSRSIEEHMRTCMTEKCQGGMALHCRGETPTKQELRAQCRAEFAAAKKKK